MRDSSKLIIKNSAFLYFRMVIVMAVGFFTSRVVLQTLGEVDFGLYNVVGGCRGLSLFSYLYYECSFGSFYNICIR